MANQKVVTLSLEKRDFEAVLRFIHNLKDNGVMDTYGNLNVLVDYSLDKQKVTITTKQPA